MKKAIFSILFFLALPVIVFADGAVFVPGSYPDIVGLWTQPCVGYLKNDGTCSTPSETDPQVGTVTDTKWCVGDGSGIVQCTSNAPAPASITEEVFLPAAWCIDGTVPPDSLATFTSTNSINAREFSGTADQDLQCNWEVPFDASGGTITFRVLAFVTQATAPANNEVVAFSLSGVSIGNSDILSSAQGTAQTSSLTADASYVQYDRLATAYSSAITVTDMAAGELAVFKLTRLATTTDTYAQKIGVRGVQIKFTRTLQ